MKLCIQTGKGLQGDYGEEQENEEIVSEWRGSIWRD